jgi:pimeloyl-ACP methyl ester carboxylesterase
VGRWLGLQTARLLGLTLVVAVLGGLAFRDRLIFHPVAGPDRATPRNYSLNYEEFWLTTAAGDRVRVWRLPPPGGAPGRTALFFQGNSGNLSLILNHLTFLNSLGLNVLAVDYPGYGPSPGRPGEEAVYQSAEALWQWAVRNGAAPEDLLIYGFSLGGGTAAWLARAHPPAALVLDSTFTRLRDVPGYGRPWLIPYLKLILGSAFDTRARLAEISGPLLVLHSPGDDVVPFALGRELFQAYQNNVKYFGLSHGGHMDFLLNLALYREKLQALLAAADRKNQVSADQPLHGRGLRGKDRPGRG